MRAIYLLMLAIVLWSFSCASSRQARQTKRAYKIAAKYGLETDIVIPYVDTFIVPERTTDTIFKYNVLNVYDTITVEKEGAKADIVKGNDDSVFVYLTCPADTIIVKDTIHHRAPFISKWDNTKANVITTLTRWWRWLVFLLILLFIGSLLWKFRKFIPYIGPFL